MKFADVDLARTAGAGTAEAGTAGAPEGNGTAVDTA
jgi:hypothetical protein